MPASALEGHCGIRRVMPVDLIEVVTLHFDEEEVVYANSGAMVHCRPVQRKAGEDPGPGPSAFFPVLDEEGARGLIALMRARSLSSDASGIPPRLLVAA